MLNFSKYNILPFFCTYCLRFSSDVPFTPPVRGPELSVPSSLQPVTGPTARIEGVPPPPVASGGGGSEETWLVVPERLALEAPPRHSSISRSSDSKPRVVIINYTNRTLRYVVLYRIIPSKRPCPYKRPRPPMFFPIIIMNFPPDISYFARLHTTEYL